MDAIRKIEAALKGKLGFLPTPGPWFGHFNCVSTDQKYGKGTTINRSSGTLGKTEAEQANNEYIAACNPSAIREVLQTLASKEAELVRLREALTKLCRVFPTDSDMEAIGWTGPEIYTACNAYDDARAALTTTPQPTE